MTDLTEPYYVDKELIPDAQGIFCFCSFFVAGGGGWSGVTIFYFISYLYYTDIWATVRFLYVLYLITQEHAISNIEEYVLNFD